MQKRDTKQSLRTKYHCKNWLL